MSEQEMLRDETVTLDRRPVDRLVDASDVDAFTEQSFEVREHDEEAVVSKDARVVEEVRVKKDAAERTETIATMSSTRRMMWSILKPVNCGERCWWSRLCLGGMFLSTPDASVSGYKPISVRSVQREHGCKQRVTFHQPINLSEIAGPAGTFGTVIVHGFTADQRAVASLAAIAHELGMTTEIPLLRGHGGQYQDLRGTHWDHWMEDVADARCRLSRQVDQVILIGFSMGGLLALASAAQQPESIAGVVALAPAVRIAHPLAPLAWLARGWLPFVPMGKSVAYSDPALAAGDDSYSRLALDAFSSFFTATRRIEQMLPQITAPLLLMHARRDRVIKPISSQIVFEQVRSRVKHLVWLEHSGHALLDDCEAQTVRTQVQHFLQAQVETRSAYSVPS